MNLNSVSDVFQWLSEPDFEDLTATKQAIYLLAEAVKYLQRRMTRLEDKTETGDVYGW